MHLLFLFGVLISAVCAVLYFFDLENGFLGGICSGGSMGVMIVGALMTSRHAARIQAWKWNLLSRKKE